MKIRYLSDLHFEFVKTTEMEELIISKISYGHEEIYVFWQETSAIHIN